jgi:hypothetical protein
MLEEGLVAFAHVLVEQRVERDASCVRADVVQRDFFSDAVETAHQLWSGAIGLLDSSLPVGDKLGGAGGDTVRGAGACPATPRWVGPVCRDGCVSCTC